MENKVSSFDGKLSPNVALATLLANVQDIKNLAFVVEWKNDSPNGQWAGAYTEGTSPEQAAMYIKVLEYVFLNLYIPTMTAHPVNG